MFAALKGRRAFGPRVVVSPLRGNEYICRLSAAALPLAAKTIQPRLRRVEMHPFWCCAPLPPEGEVLAALCLEILMSPEAEWRANLPLRGRRRRRRQKGCISIARRAVGLFSSGRSPVVWFSLRGCHKLTLTPLPSIHSPTTKWAKRWWRQPPKGALPTGSIYIHRRQAIPQPPPSRPGIYSSAAARIRPPERSDAQRTHFEGAPATHKM